MFILFLGLAVKFTILGWIPLIVTFVVLWRRQKRRRAYGLLLVAVILFLIAVAAIYLWLPRNALPTLILTNAISILIGCGVGVLYSMGRSKKDPIAALLRPHLKRLTKVAMWVVIASVLIFAIIWISTIAVSKSVAHTIPTTQEPSTKQAPMPVISQQQKEVPVANSIGTVANQLQNSLSNVPNSNVYEVKHIRAQLYHNQLTYIAPLDFDGSFFRYNHYQKVDGYFRVDATRKDARPKFIKTAMRFTPSAYFSHDANRRIYAYAATRGYVLDTGDTQLEVNEQGRPYYVKTLYKMYGITNAKNYAHKAVAVMDAKTGTVKVYTLKNKPKWLDVAVDPTLAAEQIDKFGTDRNGWWNAHGFGGSRTGVMRAVKKVGTEGNQDEVTPIAYKHNIYYFASMTSTNQNQTSVLGYCFVDAATGKTYFYRERADAMTPSRAMSLAENRMKQTQWEANMPLLYRIDNRPTWVVSMLDKNGAFMSYVYLLAAGNGTQKTVAVGDDATDTLQKYRALFGIKTSTSSATQNAKKKTFSGTVYRVVHENNNTMAFMLKDQSDLFTVSLKDHPFALFLNVNDQVSFDGYILKNSVTVGDSFKNATLEQ